MPLNSWIKKELSHEIMNMKTWNFSTWSAGSSFFIHFLSFQARQEQRSQNKGTLSWEDAIPLANGEGGVRKLCLILSTFHQNLVLLKKLRWSTRYSWMNWCNSSEYHSGKGALGPRRSGLTVEWLKNGIWLYFFKAMVWLNILCNSMVGVRNHPGHLYHGKIIVGVLKY